MDNAYLNAVLMGRNAQSGMESMIGVTNDSPNVDLNGPVCDCKRVLTLRRDGKCQKISRPVSWTPKSATELRNINQSNSRVLNTIQQREVESRRKKRI